MEKISVLDYLRKVVNQESVEGYNTFLQYPTAISETLKFKLTGIDNGEAHVSLKTDVKIHANQQGTVHGGMLCELADAAIGTAHSTVIEEGESFTSIELKINFFRPVWNDTLVAYAKPVQRGRTITVYQCTIENEMGKLVATVLSTVMTLRGDKAKGR